MTELQLTEPLFYLLMSYAIGIAFGVESLIALILRIPKQVKQSGILALFF